MACVPPYIPRFPRRSVRPPPPDRAACLRTATHKNPAPLLCSRRGASFRQGAFTEFSNKRPRPPGCGAQRQTSRLQKAPRRKARHYDFVCETRAAGFQRRLRGVGRAAQLPPGCHPSNADRLLGGHRSSVRLIEVRMLPLSCCRTMHV